MSIRPGTFPRSVDLQAIIQTSTDTNIGLQSYTDQQSYVLQTGDNASKSAKISKRPV